MAKKQIDRLLNMKESKAEGAEFLRRLAIVIFAVGAFVSIVGGIVAYGSGNVDGVIYGVTLLIITAIVYGVCINLASINKSLHKMANRDN